MKQRNGGFTLLELLVVMSLLALVMVSMGSALRSMAQTESKIDAKLARNDQMRVVSYFLQQALSRVSTDRRISQPVGKATANLFQAQNDGISWVGVMPARVGMGGRHFLRLAVEDAENGRALVLRYRPWSPEGNPILGQQGTKRILVEKLTSVSIEAQGLPVRLESINAEWPRDWVKGWPVTTELPQRIRLSLVDSLGPWPPIVVQVTPATQVQSGSSGFVAGGS